MMGIGCRPSERHGDNAVSTPIIEQSADKEKDAADEILPRQEAIEQGFVAFACERPEIGDGGDGKERRANHEGKGRQVHHLQGDEIVGLNDLDDVDHRADHEQDAADDEAPRAGLGEVDGRQKENAADDEQHGSKDIGPRRPGFEPVPHRFRILALPGIDENLDQVVPGHEQVDQRAEKEDPGAKVSIGRKRGEEADAAEDEDQPAGLIGDRIDRLPPEILSFRRRIGNHIVKTRSIDEHMRHAVPRD